VTAGPTRVEQGEVIAGVRPGAVAPVAAVRRVRVAVTRVDPWTVMKLAFVLSVALAVVTVVATSILWWVLDSAGVFTSVSGTVTELIGQGSSFRLTDFLGYGRVLRVVLVVSLIDVILLTALATLTAFLFNLAAGLVGGVEVTLTEGG
jgi:hypothetical protein